MKRILLVEDDPDLAAGLLFALKEEGYETKHAANKREACNLLNEPFDLAVLDVMLPDGSGFDLCREIRQRSDMPILFLTSRDDELDIVKGLDGGGDDYVTKPFNPLELVARVKSQIRRYSEFNVERPKNEEEIIVNDMVINTASREVFIGEKRL